MRSPGCARGRRTLLGELPPRALRYSGMTPASRKVGPDAAAARLRRLAAGPPSHRPGRPRLSGNGSFDASRRPQTPSKGARFRATLTRPCSLRLGGALLLSPCAAPQVAVPRSDPGRIG